MKQISKTFAALSDPIRLRCLALIAVEHELCVCELVGALDIPQPRISRHLAVLRDAGILEDRREAQWVLYRMAADMPPWAQSTVTSAIAAMATDEQYVRDLKGLAKTTRPMQSALKRSA